MDDNIILEFKNVTKKFPGVVALNDVSFKIRRGEIHGICGENGAGKSTLMKILSGVYSYNTYEGSIIFNGEKLKLGQSSIQEAGDKGIAIVYQELTLIPTMSVGENVFLGREPVERGSINWNKLYANTREILSKYELDVSPHAIVKDLGVGKMQMVEIAKALSEKASILILDEPTSALSETEIEKLIDILGILKNNGITCIYITHKLDELFRITDQITVLRDGKKITTELTKDLTQEKLVSYMVGREMKERFPKGDRQPGEVIFKVENLQAVDPNETSRTVLNNISFDVRKGEILGIAGLMGSGRTELVMTLFGEYGKIVNGRIVLNDQEIKPMNARQAIDAGLSLVPEDRKGMGLVLIQSILKNISLPNLDQFSSFFRIDADQELKISMEQAKSLTIKAPSLEAAVETLSGGNQQKVVISKWLLSKPTVLIMDDPTRGVDVGAKYEIYKLMNDLAASGVAIIMISSELEEVLGMSDRVMVMCRGHSISTLPVAEATVERVMALATGVLSSKERHQISHEVFMNQSNQVSQTKNSIMSELIQVLRLNVQTYTILLALIGIWIFFFFTTDGTYLAPQNISNLFRQMSVTAFLAAGMVLIIVTGNIDLSVGKLAGFVSVVAAYLQANIWFKYIPDQPVLSAILTVIISLFVGGLFGALQGYIIAYLRVPSFIVTLGGLWLFNGLILLVTEGKTIPANQPWFADIAQGYVPITWGWVFGIVAIGFLFWNMYRNRQNKLKHGFEIRSLSIDLINTGVSAFVILIYVYNVNNYKGIQNPVLLLAITAMIMMYVSNNTRFGRYSYAIGGNKDAARLSGINIPNMIFKVFTLMGFLSGVGGVVLASYVGYGTTAAGTGYELDAIASCILGGTSTLGGIGTIPGAMIGALIIASLSTGLQMMNVAPAWQYVLKAIVLVLAVLADVYFKKNR